MIVTMKRKTILKHSDFVTPPDSIIGRSEFFIIRTKLPTIPGDARYGLVAPKRSFKLAVQRNRAKRLIRDWIAHNENLMLPNYDYIFIVNYDVLTSTRANGRYEVKWALKKITKLIYPDEN